jgi:integrase/recombinase XerC
VTGWEELIGEYLGWMSANRRLSPHTVTNYRRDLAKLHNAVDSRPPDSLYAADIRHALARLHASGLSPRSLARALAAWRGFYRFLARQHGVKANPCVGLRPPKAPRTLPHALSPDAAQQLLESHACDPMLLRDRSMFELLYSSGLRLAELVSLDLGQVQMQTGEVTVTGKGNKTRIVPVGSRALEALRNWLGQRDAFAGPDERALFVGRTGRRISPRSVQQRLRLWAIRQGLGQHVHPHMLRHSFASHVLQSSGDLRAVQEMLGHANISTTQVYTHLDFQHLAKVYDAAHPRAKRKT